MEQGKKSILSDEEFIQLTMSSQDAAVTLLWKEYQGDEAMRNEAEKELRLKMEDIVGQRKKDNTIKDHERKQAITKALAVASSTAIDG